MRKITSVLLTLLLLFATLPFIGASAQEVPDVASLAQSLLDAEMAQSGAESLQEWIDTSLSSGAGKTSEWYIYALRNMKSCDFSGYAHALNGFLDKAENISAVTRQRYALALLACGQADNGYVTATANETIGTQGVMSLVFGLHLLTNGAQSTQDTQSVISQLLSMKNDDGGWSLSVGNSDVDITAMVIQSLAPYTDDANVQNAIDGAVLLLSERQLSSGGFTSYGAQSPESAAQVIIALASVGIDAREDERFVKDGNDILSFMLTYSLPDNRFSHTQGGEYNLTSTVQSLLAFNALERLSDGKSPVFVFDSDTPDAVSETPASSVATQSGDTSVPDGEEPYDYVVITVVAAAVVFAALVFVIRAKKRKS